jgi:hypothetical protein
VVAKALRCFWKESDFFLRNRVLVAESAKKYDLTTNTKATKDYFLKLRALRTFVVKAFSVIAVWPARGPTSRNHAEAFDIEDGADPLCLWFDDRLDSATDFQLHGIIRA